MRPAGEVKRTVCTLSARPWRRPAAISWPGPPSCLVPPQPVEKRRPQLRQRPARDVRPAMDDDVETGLPRVLAFPEDLPKPPPRLVSHHRVADFPAQRHPEPGAPCLIREDEEDEIAARDTEPTGVNRLELPAPVQPVEPGEPLRAGFLYTVNLLRPLARLRFSTRRPFAVFIRARNPCFFLRRSLLGWNVLLAMNPPRSHTGSLEESRILSAVFRSVKHAGSQNDGRVVHCLGSPGYVKLSRFAAYGFRSPPKGEGVDRSPVA